MQHGIYESLITQIIHQKLEELDKEVFYVSTSKIDKAEASRVLTKHLSSIIQSALDSIDKSDAIELQIEIANKIIILLKDALKNEDFNNELIAVEAEILNAVFSKIDNDYADLNLRLKEITPYTRLTHSELFTGGNVGISLESELKKEILSADEIDLLVSFIKFKGIIILERELKEFTKRGSKLRVITSTYMGASDYKAIKLLSELENTEVKISYNSSNERLHAKAYLFKRNTGFDTAYIGSSNFSRSALTDGLEWNLKVTTKEVGHIIDKFKKTFDSYWQSDDFETFDSNLHTDKLIESLNQGRSKDFNTFIPSFFDLKPYPFQSEILEKLQVERDVHNRHRNLVVAATGTGKTVISAFDYKSFTTNNKSARLLFLAHRKEILQQSLGVFRGILKDNNFGELWLDGYVPNKYEHVFASVQTINNKIEDLKLSPDYFDFIIIDECHHMAANSYRPIINYFIPKVLLGLTATPERMDGGNIQEDFHNRIAAEIRLPEALNRKLLCPFQYFGITDSVDLTNVSWARGKYIVSELTSIYTSNDRRVREIIDAINKYTKDINDLRALGFCVSIEHAKYMAEKFTLAGLKADCLTSDNASERDQVRNRLQKKEINYLFVVDIFNEGVDIPEIDTVLFLRPTESLTIFLQQLGRGLRLAENKDCLTVLDFVGNARPEYNFENKFRALIGKTSTPVRKEIEDNFPHLPLGCSIILEKKTKEIILENIKNATSLNRAQLISKIKSFEHQTNLSFNLKNFIEYFNIPLQFIYKRVTWKRLCVEAGKISDFDNLNESEIYKAISNKWLSTNSSSYFQFLLKIAKKSFNININDYNQLEQQMLLMLCHDVWTDTSKFKNLEDAIRAIGKNKTLVDEIIELLEILEDRVDFKEIDIDLPYTQPLKLHARYTSDQIMAAFKHSTFEKKGFLMTGVLDLKDINTELFFITLTKSDENFSPSTLYDDYAINEYLFHWQSQNSASPNTPKGNSYINHLKTGKKILLFVREKKFDEYGNTMGFVFIGDANYLEHYGAKPMNIKWQLKEPLPNYLWKDAAKLRAG